MKITHKSFRLVRALLATAFLAIGFSKASAMVDPAPMHMPCPAPQDGGSPCISCLSH